MSGSIYCLRRNSRAGFTLTELIVVLVVLAIIAATVIPSVVGFIWHGQQINRMNIARTVYLSMQNQLTRNILEGNLRETLTSHFYETGSVGAEIDPLTGYYKLNDRYNTVRSELGINFPAADADNVDYVYYVSIPRGFTPNAPGNDPLQDDFYRLLDGIIINKDLLNDAFLMEFNIRTGVIMSVFYGDRPGGQEQFGYGTTLDRANVIGGRGMGGSGNPGETPYEFAYERRQGYYGVDWTGEPTHIPLHDIADIFDGTNKRLEDRENVLFAELFVPKNRDTNNYLIDFVDEAGKPLTGFTAKQVRLTNSLVHEDLHEAIDFHLVDYIDPDRGGELLYYPLATGETEQNFTVNMFGVDVSASYDYFIWVLDCVFGDLFSNDANDLSVGKYSIFNTEDPQFIRARLVRQGGVSHGVSTVSLTTDHSHYGGELSGKNNYEIKSARHLSNIRFFPGYEYRQTMTVNMLGRYNIDDNITNFVPIKDFSGSYSTMNTRPRIDNLVIDTSARPPGEWPNVGLFANTNGANINGISLFNAKITARQDALNTGAIAGLVESRTNDGGTQIPGVISNSYSYATVTGGGTAMSNTGGLVGQLDTGSELSQSFNAGFFDTNAPDGVGVNDKATRTDKGTGSVTGTGGNIGGLTGINRGTIQYSYNNARVNVADVDWENGVYIWETGKYGWLDSRPAILSTDPVATALNSGVTGNLGGITGSNTGVIRRVYATNFVGDGGANTGGITGAGSAGITDSYYLVNGCTGDGGTAVAKSELRDLLQATTTFNPGPGKNTYENAYEGYNLYDRYPYPVLRGNSPPVTPDLVNIWGWEDIEGEILFGYLVYYELYNDGGWGLSEESLEVPRPPLAAAADNRLVVNDGYSIEVPFSSSGFTLIIGGEDLAVRKVFNLTMHATGAPAITVTAADDPEEEPLEWPSIRFTAAEDEMYRLYIPNSVFEGVAIELVGKSTELTPLGLYRGTDNTSGDPVVFSTEINPFFALPRERLIRSPRHIDNIDSAYNGLSGDYIQQLNVDFAIYRKELTEDRRVVPASILTFINEAVVKGTFTGTYNGNNRFIDRVTVTGAGDYVGLFGQSSGNIRNLIMRETRITGKDYVGAIAGRNSGMIEGSVLRNYSAASVTNDTRINASGSNAGGITGENTASGTIRRVSLLRVDVTGALQYTGGVAGSNSGNIGQAGISQNGTAYTELRADNLNSNIVLNTLKVDGGSYVGGVAGQHTGGTITDCSLIELHVSGRADANTYAGGIVGMATGTIRRSFVGHSYGGLSEYNTVTGAQYIGGIVGALGNGGTGLIEISYVDWTRVGATGATSVGGIAGYMNVTDSADRGIRNVFYNYGNAAPQFGGYIITVVGNSTSTGGLVGNYQGGQLTYSYSDAFFNTGNHFVVGTTSAALPASLNNTTGNVLYLKVANYNTAAAPTNRGRNTTLEDLRTSANILNGGAATGQWVRGSGGTAALVTTPYTYPRLQSLQEPRRWPYPDNEVYEFRYYERYEDGSYGFWGGESSDMLDYNKKVLEDGYIVAAATFNVSSARIQISPYNGGSVLLPNNTRMNEFCELRTIDGVSYYVLASYRFENVLRTHAQDSIIPIRVFASMQGNIDASDFGNTANVFNVYVNPLFAKSIWSIDEFNRIPAENGGISVVDYFRNVHQYSIRTPRQIRNIGTDASTLRGRFLQEVDIDFSAMNINTGALNQQGYCYYTNTSSSTPFVRQYLDISSSVVTGSFTGRYTANSPYGFDGQRDDDNRIPRAIKNITLPNQFPIPPDSMSQAKPGNIGIFSQVGAGGIVEYMILQNNNITGTTGNVGGLAGVNEGAISRMSVVNSKVTATGAGGRAGGITGANRGSGTIDDILFISNTDSSPVTAVVPITNAGGIAAVNEGAISNAIYLAHAPGENPIAHDNTSGTVANAYYLSGPVSASNRSSEPVDTETVNLFNDFTAENGGQPLTSQEIRMTLNIRAGGWANVWTPAGSANVNVLTYENYPYPYLFREPVSWPVATVPAETIAYYEIYDDGSDSGIYGFSTAHGGNPLIDDLPIKDYGYCVIMPDSYTPNRSIRLSTAGNAMRQVTRANGVNMVMIDYNSTGLALTPLTVNDVSSLYINTLFAKGVYSTASPELDTFSIRTPRHMQNISRIVTTELMTFNQEHDLDFAGVIITDPTRGLISTNGAVVAGDFKGTYDGGGYLISNVTINAPLSALNVGLFSQNSGTIQRVTLVFTGNSHMTAAAAAANIGSIAGVNNEDAEIIDVTVISTLLNEEGEAVIPVNGVNAGGLVGLNDGGKIERVQYLALAPGSGGDIFPIVRSNENSGTIGFAYFLRGEEALIFDGTDDHLLSEPFNMDTVAGGEGEGRTTPEFITPPISTWLDWNDPIPGSYPYRYILRYPAGWPVVVNP